MSKSPFEREIPASEMIAVVPQIGGSPDAQELLLTDVGEPKPVLGVGVIAESMHAGGSGGGRGGGNYNYDDLDGERPRWQRALLFTGRTFVRAIGVPIVLVLSPMVLIGAALAWWAKGRVERLFDNGKTGAYGTKALQLLGIAMSSPSMLTFGKLFMSMMTSQDEYDDLGDKPIW